MRCDDESNWRGARLRWTLVHLVLPSGLDPYESSHKKWQFWRLTFACKRRITRSSISSRAGIRETANAGSSVRDKTMGADPHHSGGAFDTGSSFGPVSVASGHQLRVIQLLIGLALATAALAKLWSLWDKGADSQLSLGVAASEIALINLEFLCALLFVFDIWRRLMWLVGLLLFASFAVASASKIVHGNPSCNCFGEIRVNPWLSLSLDLIVLALLAGFGARLYSEVAVRRQVAYAVRAFAVAGIVGGLYCAVKGGVPALLTGGAKATVHLNPAEWLGKPLPILDSIDVGPQLNTGSWRLVFFSRSCDLCRAEIRRLTEAAEAGFTGDRRLAFIELPSNEAEEGSADPSEFAANSRNCLFGRLDPKMEWIAAVPIELEMKNGVVEMPAAENPLDNVSSAAKKSLDLNQQYAQHEQNASQDKAIMDVACGPLSVIALLESGGFYLEREKKRKLIEQARPLGTNLLQLKGMLEAEGLHCLGARLSMRRLHEIGLPAIITTGSGGFAAITRYSDGAVEVVYANKRPEFVKDSQLEFKVGAACSALLASEEPIDAHLLRLGARGKPPIISLSRTMCTVGIVRSVHWKSSITLHNNGDEPIEITSVTPSCRCIKVAVEPTRLEPGRNAVLQVDGRASRIGPIREVIKIQTSAMDEGRLLTIPVRGWLEPVAIPSRLAVSFEELMPGQKATQSVPIEAPDAAEAELSTIYVPPGAPLSASFCRDSKSALQLRIDWLGSQQVGYQLYAVELRDRPDAKAIQSSTIDVSCSIVPAFSSQPSSLFITDQELKSGWRRQIDLTFVMEDKRVNMADKLNWEWNPPARAQAIVVHVARDTMDTASRRRWIRLTLQSKPDLKSRISSDSAQSSLTVAVRGNVASAVTVPVWLGRGSFYRTVAK
jgi:hypothetical protein